jgi:2-polyprenyl-6-methoxyphenol hydroxylase-like FAD-dependent oxidoreductase
MSPFKGQGANQAFLDALALAKTLLTTEIVGSNRIDLFTALKNYEQEMCGRSAEKVLKSRQAAVSLHSKSVLTVGDITRASAAAMNDNNMIM